MTAKEVLEGTDQQNRSDKLDSQEIFEEIISLLNCYSMKLYSSKKAKKIKEILEEDDSSES